MTKPVVERDELAAVIEARRELGSEHDAELVEAFAQRIERRLAERAPSTPAARGGSDTGAVVLGVSSLIFAVPLVAIASGSGALAILAVMVLLVAVNWLYHQRTT